MRGFVHILKGTSQVPGTLSYTIIFAPVGPTGTGGAVPSKNLQDKNDVIGFLQQMQIGGDSIKDALRDLEANGNATIALVDLPEDELRSLRLIA